MAVKIGSQVTGHLTNPVVGRVEFSGTVTDIYQSGCETLVNIACADGQERTARAENVTAAPTDLTSNMVRTLDNLVRHGQIPADGGTRAMNEAGCTFPALQALIRRGLAEVVGTGERLTRFDGGTYEPRVFQPTPAGRAAVR